MLPSGTKSVKFDSSVKTIVLMGNQCWFIGSQIHLNRLLMLKDEAIFCQGKYCSDYHFSVQPYLRKCTCYHKSHNTLKLEQNKHEFAGSIFKGIFFLRKCIYTYTCM